MNCVRITRWSIAAVVFVTTVLGSSHLMLANEPPESITFEATEMGRIDQRHIPPYSYDERGNLYVDGVRYGKLRDGFALPVLGAIYRVRSADSSKVVFDKVSVKELAPGTNLTAGSYALPLHSNGMLNHWQFNVDGIEVVSGKPQVKIVGYIRAHSMSGTYQIGDSLNVNKSLHRIVNIVPPQDKFEGWIELDGKGREGPDPPLGSVMEVRRKEDKMEVFLKFSKNERGAQVLFYSDKQRQGAVDFLVKHKGFTLAFIGKVYRVTKVDAESILCERVADEMLPPKSVPIAGNYLLPIGLWQGLDKWEFNITKVAKDGRTATFEGLGDAAGKLGTYKAGDKIEFNGVVHNVVNIVASNEAEKLVGWVEITPSPRHALTPDPVKSK